MLRDVTIANRSIGYSNRPFVIAEMSGNHNQSLKRALAIVEAAAGAGVDALKLQTYTADTMTLELDRDEFTISDPRSLWHGKSLYQLYRDAYTPWEWHEPIFRRCHELGIIAFSTPFDATAVDFLESLSVPAYKVASFENTDLPLIRRIARTGKPMIISTGMASVEELQETVDAARSAGCSELVLLKCTSSYPTLPKDSNLKTITDLIHRFEVPVGLSDHTTGTEVALVAIGLGAAVVEKHFTLSRRDGGPDAAFSLEPSEMSQLTTGVSKAWAAMGSVMYGSTDNEKRSLQFRRSLYVVTDVKAGDCLTKDNLRAIRPGFGLSPKYFDQIIGKRVTRNVAKGTPVSFEIIAAEGDPA